MGNQNSTGHEELQSEHIDFERAAEEGSLEFDGNVNEIGEEERGLVAQQAGQERENRAGGSLDLVSLFSASILSRLQSSAVHSTVSIRCLVNVRKESIKILFSESASPAIQITVDAVEDCVIRFYWNPTEIYKEGDEAIQFQTSSEAFVASVSLKKGLNQACRTPEDLTLKFDEDESTRKLESEIAYHLVIEATAEGKESEALSGALERPIATQLTYLSVKKVENEYELKILKVKVKYGNQYYVMHEVYGGSSLEDDSQGNECVICMTDPRDTTILPCRHMCLCAACADVLRNQTNKCPICRSHVKALLCLSPLPNSKPPKADHTGSLA